MPPELTKPHFVPPPIAELSHRTRLLFRRHLSLHIRDISLSLKAQQCSVKSGTVLLRWTLSYQFRQGGMSTFTLLVPFVYVRWGGWNNIPHPVTTVGSSRLGPFREITRMCGRDSRTLYRVFAFVPGYMKTRYPCCDIVDKGI